MKKKYVAVTIMLAGLVACICPLSHADPIPMPTPMPGGTIATKDVTVDFTYDLGPFQLAHPTWGTCKAVGASATLKSGAYNETEMANPMGGNPPSHVTFINVPMEEDGTLDASVGIVCENKPGMTGFSAAQQTVAITQYYAIVNFKDLP